MLDIYCKKKIIKDKMNVVVQLMYNLCWLINECGSATHTMKPSTNFCFVAVNSPWKRPKPNHQQTFPCLAGSTLGSKKLKKRRPIKFYVLLVF
jgi:hypothetical protein